MGWLTSYICDYCGKEFDNKRDLLVHEKHCSIHLKNKKTKREHNKKKILEEEFDPRIHVKEYKRTCKECGKVWHSLASREEEVEKNIRSNAFSQCTFCGMPGAQLQAKRNVESGQSELERLKSCPNCGSQNYTEEVIIYEKK